MSNEVARIAQLHAQGFHCSQILVILGLEQQGKTNPDLVRSMTGLVGGLGFTGKICGTLVGAVCLLGLYAGRGEVEERENHVLNAMIEQLVDWFEVKFGEEYGGIDCSVILQDDPWNRLTRCPQIVTETYFQVKELLEENGFLPASEDAVE